MATKALLRAVVGAGVGAAGLLFATWAAAPPFAALVALLAGVAAASIAWSIAEPKPAPAPPIEITGLPPLPEAADLLEGIDDPLLIVRNRRVLYANAAARAVLGEHIQGVDVRLAIRHPAAAERLIDRAPGEPRERFTRTELVGLGERDRRWEMATTLLDDGSRLVRLTDKSEAHASEQMRVDFVANASHELRTPLATILGFLETLSEEDSPAAADPPTRSRFIKIMFDEARRIQQLVDDLISLSRIEAERFSLPRESVALLPIVDEISTNCANLLQDRGGEIVVDSSIEDPVVLGDRSQLAQMLQNLVVNALKYGRPGTPVTIRFDDAGSEMLVMSVIDRGDGIPPEHLPRLTERFYRVDPSRSRSMGGTGLGLAIVKHIVHRHRGRLEIDSRLGEGSMFRVFLPQASGALSSKGNINVTRPTPNGPTEVTNPS